MHLVWKLGHEQQSGYSYIPGNRATVGVHEQTYVGCAQVFVCAGVCTSVSCACMCLCVSL